MTVARRGICILTNQKFIESFNKKKLKSKEIERTMLHYYKMVKSKNLNLKIKSYK